MLLPMFADGGTINMLPVVFPVENFVTYMTQKLNKFIKLYYIDPSFR